MGVVVGVGVTVVVVAVVGVVVESSSVVKLLLGVCIPPGQSIISKGIVANVTLFSLAHLLRKNTNSFPIFATGVPVGPVFLLGLLVPAIVAAYASRAAVTLSATSFLMAA
ncbi:hypothetical protein Tco_0490079 [Tanacetum coccineum]